MDDSSRTGESKLALKWNIDPTLRSWNSHHHDVDAAADDDEIKTVFFSQILSCSQSGDHPETNLTKFGYKSDMKV